MSHGFISFLLCILFYAGSLSANVCYKKDTRDFSQLAEIGRLQPRKAIDHRGRTKSTACTVNMISNKCGITAGHCYKHFYKAEFNVPLSIGRKTQPASPEDTYLVDSEYSQYAYKGPGNDWAVIRFFKNEITGKFPGEKQGYLEITESPKFQHQEIFLAGYGLDYRAGDRNFTQQIAWGKIIKIENNILYHDIDSSGGTSGAAILESFTGKIIGINTHGGCGTRDIQYNRGSIIHFIPEFQNAIATCLRENH